MNKVSRVTLDLIFDDDEDVRDIKCGDEFYVSDVVGDINNKTITLQKICKIGRIELNTEINK